MFWLRREVLLPLLTLLYLTAPLSWPLYTSCLLVTNLLTSGLAHTAFRRYQLLPDPTIQLPTVVHSLMYLLSILLQVNQVHLDIILLIRLLNKEDNLRWYQDQPLMCLSQPRVSSLISEE